MTNIDGRRETEKEKTNRDRVRESQRERDRDERLTETERHSEGRGPQRVPRCSLWELLPWSGQDFV